MIPSTPTVTRTAKAKAFLDKGGIAVIPVVFLIAAAVFVPNFASPGNIVYSLGLSLTTTGIVACGMLFALASGDFDLSVGSVAAFSGMAMAVLVAKGFPPMISVVLAVLASLVIGLLNGFLIAICRVNALIATLASMQIVRGAAYLLNDGNSLGIASDPLNQLGNKLVFGIPIPIYVLGACLIVFGLLLHKTVFGRNTLAIGGNAEAARLAGLPIHAIRILIFGIVSALAGVAGVVSAAQQQLGDPKGMVGLELRVISACVLGGVSLTGGEGGIFNVIVGIVIMGTLQNVMDLRSVATFYQYIITGFILLIAVILDRFKHAKA